MLKAVGCSTASFFLVTIAIQFFVASSFDSSPIQEYPQRANLTVAAAFPLEVIRPELFGLDLEFTRHDIWDGLSAELISNRLFAIQPPGTTWPYSWPVGFPPRWTALTNGSKPIVGPGLSSSISCILTPSEQLCGLVQLPVGDGFNAGMDFGSAIGVEEGKGYLFQIVVKAFDTNNASGLTLSVTLAPSIFAVNFSVPDSGSVNGSWTTLSYSFSAPFTTPHADSLTLSVQAEQGTLLFNATSLLPVDHFHGMRNDVVDALDDLDFHGPLRYPGGCYAPFYKWKDGLEPILSRPTSFTPPAYCTAVSGGVNAYSDGFMQNGPGIDEYILLTTRLNVIPAITFAIQFGSDEEIQDAKDLLEYLNGDASTTMWGAVRASRGFPQPYNVKLFYVGNEIDMQARYPNYPLQPSNQTGGASPQEYADILERFIPEVIAIDPSINLFVVYGGAQFNAQWIATDQVPFISATSAHIGYQNSNGGGSPSSPSDATLQAKLADDNVLPAVLNVRQLLNSGSGSASHVQISIDEWGLGPPWVVENFNCAHALYGASFLTMIINNALSQGIGYTNYFEPINEGAIQVLQFSASPTPLGFIMPRFGALAGSTRLLLSQNDNPSDNDIIGVASVSRDASDSSSTISIILTNRNASTGFTQMVLVDGQRVATTASVRLLNANGFSTNSYFTDETFSVPINEGWMSISMPPFSIATVTMSCISC
jgi:hypothetical protein